MFAVFLPGSRCGRLPGFCGEVHGSQVGMERQRVLDSYPLALCHPHLSEVKGIPMTGVKVTYHGNVVYCSRHRTFDLNLQVCLIALHLLTGELVDDIRAELVLGKDILAYKSS
jgi:hypothetical protein